MAAIKNLKLLAAIAFLTLLAFSRVGRISFGCGSEKELKQVMLELQLAKGTIARLQQDMKTLRKGETIEGCSPGALNGLHKHLDSTMQYFERTARDYQDDMERTMKAAKVIKENCDNQEAIEAANEIIHWYRYRHEPAYGIPLGRKKYYSGEAGEVGIDSIVDIFVGDSKNGVYLELGEPNGLTGNTRFFDKEKGWKGLMFEAGKTNYLNGKNHRPNAHLYRVALWNQTGKLVDTGQGWGHRQGDVSLTSGAGLIAVCAPLAPGEVSPQELDDAAPCFSIDHLLAGNPPVKEPWGAFDYVSLDCEGCEIHVVEKWNFEQNPTKIFTIENHEQLTPPPQWRRIVEIMRLNGYVWFFTFFDGFFVNTRLLYGLEPDAFNLRMHDSDKSHFEWIN